MDKPLEKLVGDMEVSLMALTQAQERMLGLLNRKRQALMRADREAMTQCCEQENIELQRIAELEKHRLMLVGKLTAAFAPDAKTPLKLVDIAQRLPEPSRSRLLVLRQNLIERMELVRKETGVARRAAESLMHHMQGLVQTIGGAVTGIATYNRSGGRPVAATAVSTFNATA